MGGRRSARLLTLDRTSLLVRQLIRVSADCNQCSRRCTFHLAGHVLQPDRRLPANRRSGNVPCPLPPEHVGASSFIWPQIATAEPMPLAAAEPMPVRPLANSTEYVKSCNCQHRAPTAG